MMAGFKTTYISRYLCVRGTGGIEHIVVLKKTTYISRYLCVRGTGGIEHIVVLKKTTADMVDVWHICILLQHYLAIYTTPLSMAPHCPIHIPICKL